MSLKDLKKLIKKHFAKSKEKGQDVLSFLELKDWEMKRNLKIKKKRKKK